MAITREEIQRELNARGFARGAPARPVDKPLMPYPIGVRPPPPRPAARPPIRPVVELAPVVARPREVPLEVEPAEAVPPAAPPKRIPLALIIAGGIAFLILAQVLAKKKTATPAP